MTGSAKPQMLPEQAWAHRQGRIDLLPLRAAAWDLPAVTARLQIAEAFSRFGIAHDEARVDVVASCFTEDAVFEVAQGSAEPFVAYTGREKIQQKLRSIIAEQGDQRRHCITNVVVERLADTTASALAYGLVSVAADGLILGVSVLYAADLRREDDGVWRFSRFFIGMDSYSGDQPGSALD